MTNFLTNQTAMKRLGSSLASALVLAACGTSASNETSEAATEITQPSSEAISEETVIDENDPNGPDTNATANQIVIQNITFGVPEDWTSLSQGDDVESSLAETNPEALAALQASGRLSDIRSPESENAWTGITPEGGVVNFTALSTEGNDITIDRMIAGLTEGVELTDATKTGEEDFTSSIGAGTRITLDLSARSEEPLTSETSLIDVEGGIVAINSRAATAIDARNQTNLILESAELTA